MTTEKKESLLARVREGLRDKAAEVIIGAIWSVFTGAAIATAHNFWYLFSIDRSAAIGLALSFTFLGIAVGTLASWAMDRVFPAGRMRRTLSHLPRNQMAAVWRAYKAQGSFSDREVSNDLRALSGLGVVSLVDGSSSGSWSLFPTARRVIDRSKALSDRLDRADQEFKQEVKRREDERRVQTALDVINSLDFESLSHLVRIMDVGPTEVPDHSEELLITEYGHAIISCEISRPGMILVSVTDCGREALSKKPELIERAREWNAKYFGGSD